MNLLTRQSKLKGRALSRDFVVRGVYQWLMSQNDVGVIQAQLIEQPLFHKADAAYCQLLLVTTIEQSTTLDLLLAPFLMREVNQVSVVERAILLQGACELKNFLDVPYRVVIDEALTLQKKYGSNEGSRFINGVLDRLAAQLRSTEYIQ